MTASPVLEVGYIAAAHGLHGELLIRTFDPESTVLEEVRRLLLRLKDASERELTIASRRPSPKGWWVHFAGIESRSQAGLLRGARVSVFREELEPPGEGEFFQGDLIGLSAVDEAGKILGKVAELWNTGPVPNLVIRGEGGFELIVPFVHEFVPQVELSQGRIVIRPPELED